MRCVLLYASFWVAIQTSYWECSVCARTLAAATARALRFANLSLHADGTLATRDFLFSSSSNTNDGPGKV